MFEDTVKSEDIAIKSEDITIKSEDIKVKSEDIKVKSEDTVKLAEPGTACIKSEYLIPGHIWQLNKEFVASQDKSSLPDNQSKEIDGPPKKKLKGQNKNRHRPRAKRQPKSEKLCFSVNGEKNCKFGDNCSYSHDVALYLKTKPPDINEKCYLYETYGKCFYGFSCRYGNQHIINNKNITNEELYNKLKDQQTISNSMPKQLQINLRKRGIYNFKPTDDILQLLKEARDYREKMPQDLRHSVNIYNYISTVKTKQVLNNCDEANKISVSNDYDEKNFARNGACDTSCKELLLSDEDSTRLCSREIKKVDFAGKLYLAPLTTVGNLPFRRICKEFGADITCSEMAMAFSLLQGNLSEWALMKRHHTEDIFGVQLCGAHADVMTRCSQVLKENMSVDFIDVNMGCPLDNVYKQGAGSGLTNRMRKLEEIVFGISSVVDVPLTLKMRTGSNIRENTAHNVIQKIHEWGDPVQLITLHGRSREQRYTKHANWKYINECSKLAKPVALFGSGDIFSFEDYNRHMQETSVSGIMIARGALIKPWIFKEIKEQQHWDISSSERFDILKKYTNYGLEHWGSDTEGVEKTRRFLLEWLSFLHRYIPVGLLERVPQQINERPPAYHGRNDLETIMASPSCSDWVKISEMLLGPTPEYFSFLPKHKANAYQ